MNPSESITRRQFIKTASVGVAVTTLASQKAVAQDKKFTLNYILSSCMYGELTLDEILPEVHKIGAT